MAKRKYSRVVRIGTERFDAEGVKLDPEDAQTREQQSRDDDNRILSELPPHWGIFAEKE